MAQRVGPFVQGPKSTEGNAALNSMIFQYKRQIRSLEQEKDILKQSLTAARKDNLELSSTVKDLKEKERKSGARQQDIGNYRTRSPLSVEKDKEFKSPSDSRISNDDFLSQMISDKSLENHKEVRQKFMDLTSLVCDRLAKAEDSRKRERELEEKLAYSRKTVSSLLSFFSIIDDICRSSGWETLEGVPTWLSCILTQTALGSDLALGKTWRLLQWNLHHIHDKKPSALRRGEIDQWFEYRGHQTEVEDVERALHDMYREMCSYSNVLEEDEGLQMSILSPFEDSPSSPESDDSSLCSRIPAQDLMMFRSLIQGLVEKFEELVARSQGSDDIGKMDDDMYLPQWEALETYDLGKLIQTMNSVIQTLSVKLVTATSNRKFCVQCQQAIGGEAEQRFDDGHPGLEKMSFAQAGSAQAGYGLCSNEPASEARNSGLSYPRPSFMRPAVPSAASARPRAGVFRTAGETLSPRNVTMLRTSNHLVRSKSDSSPRGQQPLKKLPGSLPTKPSSLDSVFTTVRKPPHGTSPSPLGLDMKSRDFRTSDSDSDDDFEIRGPPSISPTVRVKELLQQDTDKDTPASAAKYRHTHQKSDDSGLDGDISYDARPIPFGEPLVPQYPKYDYSMPYSQVQQCTGDSSSMTQDIFLPSSVEWSTQQLREGGIKAPSPDAMDRYSPAVNYAEQSIKAQWCVLCHKPFPASESTRRAVYDHIQGHLQPSSSPDSSLVTLTQADGPTGHSPVAAGASDVDRCPVCNFSFSANTPLKARESHINLHFESEDNGFEVLDSVPRK